jgi:hypothetical protein
LGSLNWDRTLSYCPTITFSIIDTGTGLSADSIFYINSDNLWLNTADRIKATTYELSITGSVIGTYMKFTSQSITLEVQVIDKCATAIITASSVAA